MARECVVCGGALAGQQRLYDKPECAKLAARAKWLMDTYGITLQDFDTILAYQDGRCPVCDKPFKQSETPRVDHEHGAHVRGLVHDYCNRRVIGRFRSPETVQRLADYLRRPPAVEALGMAVIAPGRPVRKRRTRNTKRGRYTRPR